MADGLTESRPRGASTAPAVRGVILESMSSSSAEHRDDGWPDARSEAARVGGPFAPGAAWPDPAVPSGPTRWVEHAERGRVEAADGTAAWGAPDPPAAVPDPLPGVEGPHTRRGWLTRGRSSGGDDAA